MTVPDLVGLEKVEALALLAAAGCRGTEVIRTAAPGAPAVAGQERVVRQKEVAGGRVQLVVVSYGQYRDPGRGAGVSGEGEGDQEEAAGRSAE